MSACDARSSFLHQAWPSSRPCRHSSPQMSPHRSRRRQLTAEQCAALKGAQSARHDGRTRRSRDRTLVHASRNHRAQRPACVLSRRHGDEAGRASRDLAADDDLEREVPGRGQRWHRRHHQLQRAGDRHPARLRDVQHGHRPRQQGLGGLLMGAWSSGSCRRLRPSRAPRDDRERQDPDEDALCHRADAFLLRRLLEGRAAGTDGGAALSCGLRRPRGGRTGAERHPLVSGRTSVGRACHRQGSRELHPVAEDEGSGARSDRPRATRSTASRTASSTTRASATSIRKRSSAAPARIRRPASRRNRRRP